MWPLLQTGVGLSPGRSRLTMAWLVAAILFLIAREAGECYMIVLVCYHIR